MRKLAPLAALTLLAPILLAGCGDTLPDPRGVDHDETLLSLAASGEAETVPDETFIELGVNSFAREARSAQAANDRKIEEIARSLTDLGVAAKDTQTRNLSLQKLDYGANKGQYQASNVLRVRMRQAARAGEAVTRATEAGANVLSGPTLRIADPEKANRGAYIAAYRAARTRAQAYAEASGKEISRVLAIRDGGQSGGGYPQPPYPMVESASDAMAPQTVAPPAPPPSIRPGTTLTRVSVQVDFALRDK